MLTLPKHNRYDYSVIEKRPDFSWPDGKRLAFYVALNVEHFAFLAGTVRKKLKLRLLSEKIGGVRTYRIGTGNAARAKKTSAAKV